MSRWGVEGEAWVGGRGGGRQRVVQREKRMHVVMGGRALSLCASEMSGPMSVAGSRGAPRASWRALCAKAEVKRS